MCSDNSDSRPIIDWSLPPDLQAQYDRVLAKNAELQKYFGIQPITLEERAAAYRKRKTDEAAFRATLGKRRPPPKWKV